MCDDGKGGAVACASAPFVFLGRTLPKTEGAWANTITLFNNVRVTGLIDFKRGHTKVNGSDRFRCVVLDRCRERWYSSEFDPKRVASVKAATDALPDSYIQEASFARFRELSIAYTLPSSLTKIGHFSRATSDRCRPQSSHVDGLSGPRSGSQLPRRNSRWKLLRLRTDIDSAAHAVGGRHQPGLVICVANH